MSMGYMVSSALYAVAQARIPDLMAGGPKGTAEMAEASGTSEDALYRILRALASIGVFRETAPRTFALTSVGEYLRSDREDSFRDMIMWIADPFHFRTYPEMPHALKTGATVVEKVTGHSCFGYFEKDKDLSAVFNAAMTMFSRMLGPAVLEAYDFSWLDGKTLVDIGGGHGRLLSQILKKYPGIHGAVFDLEHVVAGSEERIREDGLAGRCDAVPGDFFESVPAAEAYIMKHILHDWNDEQALKILRNCHRAGKGQAKVILVETVLAPGNEPHVAKWLDLEMLMLPGGRERTEEDFAKLFERGGFTLQRVVPTKSPVSVLEATKRS